jgi:hypothetical protein
VQPMGHRSSSLRGERRAGLEERICLAGGDPSRQQCLRSWGDASESGIAACRTLCNGAVVQLAPILHHDGSSEGVHVATGRTLSHCLRSVVT